MLSTIFQAPTLALAALLVTAAVVNAESHTVHFVNNCGFGTPTLVQAGNVLSTGQDYTSNGVFSSAIAYLQNGTTCLLNGENCSTIEMTLVNPTVPGGGSSADISLIPPHEYNVAVGFEFPQCPGTEQVCSSANCNTAFFQPDDTQVQRACQVDNAGITITFCGVPSSSSPPSVPSTPVVHVPIATSTSDSVSPTVIPTSAPVVHVPSSSSSSSSSSATPTSTNVTVSPPRCKNSKRSQRRSVEEKSTTAREDTRAIYETHLRRHHARRHSHGSSF